MTASLITRATNNTKNDLLLSSPVSKLLKTVGPTKQQQQQQEPNNAAATCSTTQNHQALNCFASHCYNFYLSSMTTATTTTTNSTASSHIISKDVLEIFDLLCQLNNNNNFLKTQQRQQQQQQESHFDNNNSNKQQQTILITNMKNIYERDILIEKVITECGLMTVIKNFMVDDDNNDKNNDLVLLSYIQIRNKERNNVHVLKMKERKQQLLQYLEEKEVEEFESEQQKEQQALLLSSNSSNNDLPSLVPSTPDTSQHGGRSSVGGFDSNRCSFTSSLNSVSMNSISSSCCSSESSSSTRRSSFSSFFNFNSSNSGSNSNNTTTTLLKSFVKKYRNKTGCHPFLHGLRKLIELQMNSTEEVWKWKFDIGTITENCTSCSSDGGNDEYMKDTINLLVSFMIRTTSSNDNTKKKEEENVVEETPNTLLEWTVKPTIITNDDQSRRQLNRLLRLMPSIKEFDTKPTGSFTSTSSITTTATTIENKSNKNNNNSVIANFELVSKFNNLFFS